MATVGELPTNVLAPVHKSVVEEEEEVLEEEEEFVDAAAVGLLSEEKEVVVEAAASELPTSSITSASSGSGNNEEITAVAEEVILIAHDVEAAIKEDKGEEGVDKHEDEAPSPTPPATPDEEVAIATSCDDEESTCNASTIEPTSVIEASEGCHHEEEPTSAPNQQVEVVLENVCE